MKDKPSPQDKETPEVSGLKTAGPEGEITAGWYPNIRLLSETLHSSPTRFSIHDLDAAKLLCSLKCMIFLCLFRLYHLSLDRTPVLKIGRLAA